MHLSVTLNKCFTYFFPTIWHVLVLLDIFKSHESKYSLGSVRIVHKQKIKMQLLFFINNVLNQNGKVLEELLEGSNSDAVKLTLTGLRIFKMLFPFCKFLKSEYYEWLSTLTCHFHLVDCGFKLPGHLGRLSDLVCYMSVHLTHISNLVGIMER